MPDLTQSIDFQAILDTLRLASVIRALVVILLGAIAVRLIARGIGGMIERRAGRQEAMIGRRLTTWVLGSLIFVTALNELGFDLKVLLGAAGVLTVALGFASQTSASNLISGLFLMAERPFVVGDYIQVDNRTGEVLSIDLLSVKLRTFDNLLVRVPNEDIIKKHIVNLTHFPIRRVDVQLRVPYGTDMEHVREVLDEVADANPVCMTEPAPLLVFQRHGESGMEFKYAVWGARENYLNLLNSMHVAIEAALRAAGVEIPLPKRSLVGEHGSDPVAVDLRRAAEEA